MPVIKLSTTPKPRTKTSVSAALDRVERAICLELAGHQCESCGATEGLSWAHIVQRGRKSLRWDRNNSVILCYRKGGTGALSCHWTADNLMTDRQRYRFFNKLRPDVYNYLDQQITLNFDLTLAQMLDILEMKRQELKEIKKGAL